MSVEAFVRAAGGVMGLAREGFGAGGAVVALDRRLAPPPAGPVTGSGTAVDAHDERSRLLGGQVASLGAHDVAADEQLAAALGGSAAGRARMDAVIAAAVGDVEALGLSTNTPAGRRALVEAIGRRLQETKAAVDDGGADAATHAAAADVTAAGYNGVGAAPAPAAGMPLIGMPGIGGMPAGMGGGMPMSMLPTSALQALSNLWGTPARAPAAASATGLSAGAAGGASARDKIPVGAVGFDRERFPGGKEAYQRYIARALDVMGVSDPAARRRWTTGLITAAQRESGFNPLAINLSDSNAHSSSAHGPDGFAANASRGGMQTIPGTFAAYHQAGTSTNIYDPVANICASMNYVIHRYRVAADGSDLFAKVSQFNPLSSGGGY